MGRLGQQNAEYKQRLERAVTRLSDLEEQNEQHAQVHEKMQERLHMLDDNAGHKGQQVRSGGNR